MSSFHAEFFSYFHSTLLLHCFILNFSLFNYPWNKLHISLQQLSPVALSSDVTKGLNFSLAILFYKNGPILQIYIDTEKSAKVFIASRWTSDVAIYNENGKVKEDNSTND